MSLLRQSIVTQVAVACDPLFTYLAVNSGAIEIHPLWAALIESQGLVAAMTIRLLSGIMLIAALSILIYYDVRGITRTTLKVLTAVFLCITAINIGAWLL